jgi:hypothetical protein
MQRHNYTITQLNETTHNEPNNNTTQQQHNATQYHEPQHNITQHSATKHTTTTHQDITQDNESQQHNNATQHNATKHQGQGGRRTQCVPCRNTAKVQESLVSSTIPRFRGIQRSNIFFTIFSLEFTGSQFRNRSIGWPRLIHNQCVSNGHLE